MSTERVLPAIDSRWIAQTFAFRRELITPQPLSESWMLPGQAYGTVLRDRQGRWRMWYLDEPVYTEHLATSGDGLHWESPALAVGLAHGRPNAFMTSPQKDEQGRWLSGIQGPEGFCVLDREITPHPAAKRRFTAMYLSRWKHDNGVVDRGLCIAHSDDGVRWHAGDHNPVIPGWQDTSNVFFYDERTQRYVVYGRPNASVDRATHANRLVSRCESADLIHWTPYKTVLDTDDLDADPHDIVDEAAFRGGGTLDKARRAAIWDAITEGAVQTDRALIRGRNRQWYGLTVFPYADLYLGIGMMYDIPSGHIWLELLHSYDGIDWRRESIRRSWLGDEVRWDRPMQVPFGSPPVLVGEEHWIYYSATAINHHGERLAGTEDQPLRTIGARKLPKDRWVGYTAGEREAELLTNVLPTPAAITLNAAVQAGGSLRVELCDRNGKALPGFGLDDMRPITGDDLRLPIRWKHSTLPPAKEIRLRLVARQATVFAIGWENI